MSKLCEIAEQLANDLMQITKERPTNFKGYLKDQIKQHRLDKAAKQNLGNSVLSDAVNACQLTCRMSLKREDFEEVTYTDTDIIKQGDAPDYFYVLKEGFCSVFKDE